MKFLVDTCGWIEWLTGGKLEKQYEKYLKDIQQLIVPTLIQFELYKWVSRERDETQALEIVAVTEKAKVVILDTGIALYAADIAKQHQLAMADAIIYGTCQFYRAKLITSDKHFKGLPAVEYIAK